MPSKVWPPSFTLALSILAPPRSLSIPKSRTLIDPIQGLAALLHFGFILSRPAILPFFLFAFPVLHYRALPRLPNRPLHWGSRPRPPPPKHPVERHDRRGRMDAASAGQLRRLRNFPGRSRGPAIFPIGRGECSAFTAPTQKFPERLLPFASRIPPFKEVH